MRIAVPKPDDSYGSYIKDESMDVIGNINSLQNRDFSVQLTATDQDISFASPHDTEVHKTMNEGSPGPVFEAFSCGFQKRVRSCAFPPSSRPKLGLFGSVSTPVPSSDEDDT